ncbi:hypothetical protein [Halomonas alkaliantarctica]|uniref:hypothetical protein n=1 Tax=Halomonas alkaliantarctica TaxID=232346 RepID=UPI00265ACB76|nr:hypothetical protein [Halomonas alkaliantarctica]
MLSVGILLKGMIESRLAVIASVDNLSGVTLAHLLILTIAATGDRYGLSTLPHRPCRDARPK